MKRIILLLISSVVLMIGCPFLTVALAGENGMAICFLLFFAVNPLFSALCGGLAGRNLKRDWALVFLSPFFFLAGAWLFFDFGETAFLLYAAGYLLIGAIAMLTAHVLKNRKK